MQKLMGLRDKNQGLARTPVIVCLLFITNYVCVFDYFGIETLACWLVALCVLFGSLLPTACFAFHSPELRPLFVLFCSDVRDIAR